MAKHRKSRRAIGIVRRKLNVDHLEVSQKDALKRMTEGQYAHLADIADRLEDFGRPQAIPDISIVKVADDLWAFEETGGPLGRMCVQCFFAHIPERHRIVVLGYEQMQRGDEARSVAALKMQRRLAYYKEMLMPGCEEMDKDSQGLG